MKPYLPAAIALALLTPSVVIADRAHPAVKIEIEVVVFEDGKVNIKQHKKQHAARLKKKSACECPLKSCSDCRPESGKGQCNKCPLCQDGSPATTRQAAVRKSKTKREASTAAAKITKSMMQLDANADGRLNADEVSSRLRSRFSDIDRNGDGYLDAGEIKKQVNKKLGS